MGIEKAELRKEAPPFLFTHGVSVWKDKLTAFNGVGISYDEIGNPLSDGTWSY